MPPKKRPAEQDCDPRPSKVSRLSEGPADVPPQSPVPEKTPKKRPANDDVDTRPMKIPRLSPDWPDPLPQSDSSPAVNLSNLSRNDNVDLPPDLPTSPVCSSPPHTSSPHHAMYDELSFPTHLSDEALQARLLRELQFVDAQKSRYNIGLLPNDTRWGVLNGRTVNFDRYLCLSDKPAVVRIIGTVRFTQTKNDRLNVGVEPLAPADTHNARSIQNGKARPPHGTSSSPASTSYPHSVPLHTAPGKSNLVYASKFLSGDIFHEAYDAGDLLLPWSDMQDFKMPFRRIRATDVVLLECLIRRYSPANAPYGSGWDKFSIAFELTRIARLAIGPGIPDYLPD